MPTPADTPSTDGAPDPEEVRRFRKRPIEVEAIQYRPHENCEAVGAFMGEIVDGEGCDETENAEYAIDTLEGAMWAQPGDWIIRGVRGEFYPCKPDIFEQTYERVVPEDRPAQCGPLTVERTYHKRVPDHWTVDILDEHGTVCEVPAASSTDEDAHGIAQHIAAALAAGVPALDDDTRREVKALIVMLTQNSFHLTQTEMNRIAELLADAYLGGTDGR